MNDTKEQTFLEKVKAGHPIRTRDGRTAKFIAHVPEAEDSVRLVVLIGDKVRLRYENGHYITIESNYDIVLAPKPKVKRAGWVNVYPAFLEVESASLSNAYKSEQVAKGRVGANGTTIRIEWEEEAP